MAREVPSEICHANLLTGPCLQEMKRANCEAQVVVNILHYKLAPQSRLHASES